MKHRPVRARWAAAVLGVGLAMAVPGLGWAEETETRGGGTRSTSARLNFAIQIDRMVYLRVGTGSAHAGAASGSGPAASASTNTLTFSLAPVSIPGVPTTAVDGNNQTTVWNATVPSSAVASSISLPVEVRSNAGQVLLSAQVSSPLSNGSLVLPMSDISISSSDTANLPAPLVPATGSGLGVGVALGGAGTAAAPNLLTYQSATWTFSYNPATSPLPSTYSGQITFSATAP